jgi:hypothetical protein
MTLRLKVLNPAMTHGLSDLADAAENQQANLKPALTGYGDWRLITHDRSDSGR